MGLLSKLKSVLGMGESNRSAGSGVDVTVEREADEADDAGEETTEADDAGEETTEADAGDATGSSGEPDDDDSTTVDESAEPADGDEADAGDGETGDAGTDDGGSESVSVVKGIGPAYAERLEDAGVETVADLRVADADDLADRTDLSTKRVGRWIENAHDRD